MQTELPPSEEDFVQPVQEDVPFWSENIFFFPFDYEKKIGIFSHLGRSAQDPHLWRAYIHVLLPNRRALLSKTYGRLPDEGPTVAGAGGLRYDLIEPFKRWHMSFDGVARDTDLDHLFAGPNADGRAVHLQFDLDADFLYQPWSAMAPGASGDKTGFVKGGLAGGAKTHIQQVARYTGTVTIDGETIDFDGKGFRDHSRGPRNFAARSGHTLLSGTFPSGLFVGLFEVRAVDGTPNSSQAFTVRDGIPYSAETIKVPHFQKAEVPDDWTVVLRDDRGEELVIEGRPISSVVQTIQPPNDLIQGLTHDPDEHSCILSPSYLTLNGEEGTGHLELSMFNQLR